MTDSIHADNKESNKSIHTRCPECETRFRVQDAQLQAAGGLVRCGVCMHIFNANTPALDTPLQETLEVENQIATIEAPQEAEIEETAPEALEPETPAIEAIQPEASQSEAIKSEVIQSKTSLPETDEATPVDESKPHSERSPLEILSSLNTHNHDFEHHQAPPAYRRGVWVLLCAIAALGIIGQLLLWKQQELLATPSGEKFLTLCESKHWPCENWLQKLSRESQVDAPKVQQLQSQNLLVRKHPEREHALQIDTIIVNNGSDAVPFPNLALRFSDLNDQELASRIFKPREYLAGELRGLSLLPPRQPVHIALAIVDPGPDAVNYRLELSPN
ncbi:DUF3426 domain-containing protein [Spongiibacter sp. KMU-158]|uniref:DUF3426 domain-containing protein n=1 Tax=Spongiibacter pelagi TaxID=2760804 RepID=A0A927C2H8_9GAMM|nr:DUF3426 domain-containing protein [Spongiibacter pelagi]MBD2858642.1 DUF3426 domain-containing protein [Spongiibacter pelagi]